MKRMLMVAMVIIISISLAACQSGGGSEKESSSAEESSPVITASPVPTDTAIPEPTPTPVGGATGKFLYTSSVREKARMEDGLFLDYTGYQLNRKDLVTGESEVLINKDMMSEELGLNLYRTRFSPSPDGSLIMVTASTKVTFNSFDEFENYIVSADLSTMVPILDAGATYVNWIWSPDGTMLLGDTLINNTKVIYLVNSDGSGMRKLVESPAIWNPVWSADSTQVYWLLSGLPVVTDITSAESEPVASGNLEGSLVALSFSPDGKRLAYINKAGKLYIAMSDFSDPQEMRGTFISDSCQGKFHPSIVEWSSDGEYLVISWNLCLTLNKMLFPKNQTSVVSVASGGSLDSVHGDKGELCGWAPDGSFVYRSETDEGNTLVLGEPGGTEGKYILEDYKAGCPSWIK